MTELPSVAVAISTRDRPDALMRCLASLRAGRQQPAEIVVADQSEMLPAVPLDAPARRIRARPGGLAAAQNDAVGATATPVVAILDDDCVADPGWIETIARAFAAPELGFLSGPVQPLGDAELGTHAIATRTSTDRRLLDQRTLPWDAGSGNNFAFRRDWFERIGGADERLGPGAPGKGGLDMDLFRRLLRAGAPGVYEPDAVVFHERVSTQGRLARRVPYGYGMGACCVLWLREGDRQALPVLGRWVAMRSNRLARSVVRGRWLAVREEALVLGGTARGIGFGLRAARAPRA
jgi:GT2 family glycosyltransferase